MGEHARMKSRRREGNYGLSEAWRKYINDESDYPKMEILLDDYKKERIWQTWGPAVLARWIQERPGTRPSLWWKYQAPRLSAKGIKAYYDGKLLDARQRVGGVGKTKENWLPFYRCGLPASRECWKFFDLNEPPVFEAQATYLRRHGLLTIEGEEALKDRPAAFEPEIINFTT
jgi:hypothetical protein